MLCEMNMLNVVINEIQGMEGRNALHVALCLSAMSTGNSSILTLTACCAVFSKAVSFTLLMVFKAHAFFFFLKTASLKLICVKLI